MSPRNLTRKLDLSRDAESSPASYGKLGAPFFSATFAVIMAATIMGCTTSARPPAVPLEEAAARSLIETLEASIDEDRTRLAEIVTEPRDVDANPLHDDEEIRAIAARLTETTERLEALEGNTGVQP